MTILHLLCTTAILLLPVLTVVEGRIGKANSSTSTSWKKDIRGVFVGDFPNKNGVEPTRAIRYLGMSKTGSSNDSMDVSAMSKSAKSKESKTVKNDTGATGEDGNQNLFEPPNEEETVDASAEMPDDKVIKEYVTVHLVLEGDGSSVTIPEGASLPEMEMTTSNAVQEGQGAELSVTTMGEETTPTTGENTTMGEETTPTTGENTMAGNEEVTTQALVTSPGPENADDTDYFCTFFTDVGHTIGEGHFDPVVECTDADVELMRAKISEMVPILLAVYMLQSGYGTVEMGDLWDFVREIFGKHFERIEKYWDKWMKSFDKDHDSDSGEERKRKRRLVLTNQEEFGMANENGRARRSLNPVPDQYEDPYSYNGFYFPYHVLGDYLCKYCSPDDLDARRQRRSLMGSPPHDEIPARFDALNDFMSAQLEKELLPVVEEIYLATPDEPSCFGDGTDLVVIFKARPGDLYDLHHRR